MEEPTSVVSADKSGPPPGMEENEALAEAAQIINAKGGYSALLGHDQTQNNLNSTEYSQFVKGVPNAQQTQVDIVSKQDFGGQF